MRFWRSFGGAMVAVGGCGCKWFSQGLYREICELLEQRRASTVCELYTAQKKLVMVLAGFVSGKSLSIADSRGALNAAYF
jgi:hypothetical protein